MPLNPHTEKLLQQAIKQRAALKSQTNAIRLVNGKGDQLEGLVLEQYDKHFVAQVFNKTWLGQREQLRDFLLKNFQVDFLVIKDRSQSASSRPEAFRSQVMISKNSSKTIIQEHNLIFEVDLNDTLNTGLFLDMRHNRLKIGKLCEGKRVLNCFSYTCSFGAYARAFKASEVINVDISSKILDRGKRNYEFNKLLYDQHEFIKADATEYLTRAVKKSNRFDVIIIDPPSFARAKNKVFNINKALPDLIANAIQVLNEGAKLFVSTNNSNITFNKLEDMMNKESHVRNFKKLTRLGQDKDFVGSGQMKESYLAALLVEY